MWSLWREHLEADGSLRDLRVVGDVGAEEWRLLLAALERAPFQVTVDHALPTGPLSSLLPMSDQDPHKPVPCVGVIVGAGKLLFNFHLNSVDWMECDLDPKEVVYQQDAETILAFIRWFGTTIHHDIELVDEMAPHEAPYYLRFFHLDDRFEFSPEGR